MNRNQIANFKVFQLSATPVLDTTETAAGDVLSAPVAFTPALPPVFTCEILGVTVLDLDGQESALDVVLTSGEASAGTPGSAAAMTAANARKVLRVVSVAAADYAGLASGRSFADVSVRKPLKVSEPGLWVALIARTAGKTFTAGGIVLTLWGRADDPR